MEHADIVRYFIGSRYKNLAQSTDEGVNPEKGLIEGKSICPCRNKKNCTRTPT